MTKKSILNVGDKIAKMRYGNVCNIIEISRVTNKMAFACGLLGQEAFKFHREYTEGYRIKEVGEYAYSSTTWYHYGEDIQKQHASQILKEEVKISLSGLIGNISEMKDDTLVKIKEFIPTLL